MYFKFTKSQSIEISHYKGSWLPKQSNNVSLLLESFGRSQTMLNQYVNCDKLAMQRLVLNSCSLLEALIQPQKRLPMFIASSFYFHFIRSRQAKNSLQSYHIMA